MYVALVRALTLGMIAHTEEAHMFDKSSKWPGNPCTGETGKPNLGESLKTNPGLGEERSGLGVCISALRL